MNSLGGCWQLPNLDAYKRRHGDCSVPQRLAEGPGLGRWAHEQRKSKKALDCGEPCQGMVVVRAAKY